MTSRKVDGRRSRLVALRCLQFRLGESMNHRFRYLAAAAGLAAPLALAAFVAAQSADEPPPWTVPLTTNGQPDFQGHWTNDTYTPLERPAELGDKESFTPEEAAAFFQSPRRRACTAKRRTTSTTTTRSGRPRTTRRSRSLRTSLIVEPRNGRLPRVDRARRGAPAAATRDATSDVRRQRAEPLARRALHLVGQRRAADDAADLQRESADSAEQRSRRHPPRDDARRPHDLLGRPTASAAEHPMARRSLGRPLRRPDARRRHDELHAADELPRLAAEHAARHLRERAPARRRALHAHRRGHDSLRVHRRRPRDVDRAVVGRDGDPPRRRADLRVRVPRRQLRPRQHPARRARRANGKQRVDDEKRRQRAGMSAGASRRRNFHSPFSRTN